MKNEKHIVLMRVPLEFPEHRDLAVMQCENFKAALKKINLRADLVLHSPALHALLAAQILQPDELMCETIDFLARNDRRGIASRPPQNVNERRQKSDDVRLVEKLTGIESGVTTVVVIAHGDSILAAIQEKLTGHRGCNDENPADSAILK